MRHPVARRHAARSRCGSAPLVGRQLDGTGGPGPLRPMWVSSRRRWSRWCTSAACGSRTRRGPTEPRRSSRSAAATAVFSWTSVSEQRPVVALLVLPTARSTSSARPTACATGASPIPSTAARADRRCSRCRASASTVRFLHGGIDLDLTAKASAAESRTAAERRRREPDDAARHRGPWRKLPFTVAADTGPVLDLPRDRPDLSGARPGRGRRRATRRSTARRRHRPGADRRRPGRRSRRRRSRRSRPSSAAPARCQGGPRRGRAEGGRGQLRAVRREGARRRDRCRRRAELDAQRRAQRRPRDARRASRPTSPTCAGSPGSCRRAPARPSSRRSRPRRARQGGSERASVEPRRARPRGAPAARATSMRELSYSARRLHADELPWLQSGTVEAALADGRLTVSRFDVGIAQGHVGGRARSTLRRCADERRGRGRGARRPGRAVPADPAGKSRFTRRAQRPRHAEGERRLGRRAAGQRLGQHHGVARRRHDLEPARRQDRPAGRQDGAQLPRRRRGDRDPLRRRDDRRRARLGPASARSSSTPSGREPSAPARIDLARRDARRRPHAGGQAGRACSISIDRSGIHGPLRQPARELVARAPAPATSARGCSQP